MMTEPAKPANHPAPEDAPTSGVDHAPNGVPPAADDAVAKGVPTSDRQATETAASPDKYGS